jgi:tetratricopeptide (TPR) repeat protein
MRFSPFVVLLCVGVLGCGSGTEPAETPSASQQAVIEYNKAFASVEKEDWPTAIACFTESIRLDPHYVSAYNNRGNTYLQQGKYDEAIADYTEAIRLDPDLAYAYYNRGVAYQNQGKKAKAEADFAKAKELGYAP